MSIPIAMTDEAIYSKRACPKGCSLSAGFDAMARETIDTTELNESDKLFQPSAKMAILPEITPINILSAARSMFMNRPRIAAFIFSFWRP
jgi:hypothetical protein